MKYAKLINNRLQLIRQPIHTETEDIFTNDETIIREHGYKELVSVNPPEAPEGYHYEMNGYDEDEATIFPTYTLVENEADISDYIEALERLGVTDE